MIHDWADKGEDIPLGKLTEFACDNLPEDWGVNLLFREGECGVDLIDPDGENVEICTDEMSMAMMVNAYINHARASDGLMPAYLPGFDPDDD